MKSYCEFRTETLSHDGLRALYISVIEAEQVLRKICSSHVAKEKQRERNKRHAVKKKLARQASVKSNRIPISKEERRRREYDRALQKKYGITLADREKMFAAQEAACAICKTTEFGKRALGHTDHCHKTGKVRGVLCARCNAGLGYYWDSPQLLRAAADYLERSE